MPAFEFAVGAPRPDKVGGEVFRDPDPAPTIRRPT